jgi:hypothetical protein
MVTAFVDRDNRVNNLGREPVSGVADFLHPHGYSATGRTAKSMHRDNASLAAFPLLARLHTRRPRDDRTRDLGSRLFGVFARRERQHDERSLVLAADAEAVARPRDAAGKRNRHNLAHLAILVRRHSHLLFLGRDPQDHVAEGSPGPSMALRRLPEPKVCAGCAQVLWTSVYVIGYMLAILGRAKVMIIKQLTALAVLALTLSGCAPLPIGTAAGGATALVVTDPHWCREHRNYRYDLEWHLHHCGGWCTVSGCGH